MQPSFVVSQSLWSFTLPCQSAVNQVSCSLIDLLKYQSFLSPLSVQPSMKALRELRDTWRERGSVPLRYSQTHGSGAKHAISLQPPKRVIRATRDYVSKSPHELSFHNGDFFHVLSDEDPYSGSGWIEACNPMTCARGYVPINFFDVLERSVPRSAFSLNVRNELNPHGSPLTPSLSRSSRSDSTSSTRTSSSTLATFKYNFQAELPHELSGKEGDSVLIVAKSNNEWLVAKHVGQISSPGLVPVTFMAFRNQFTGQPLEEESYESILAQIPSVAEWEEQNKHLADQAIPLGTIDHYGPQKCLNDPLPPLPTQLKTWNTTPSAVHVINEYFPETVSLSRTNSGLVHDPTSSQMGLLTSASVDGMQPDSTHIWFCVRASFTSAMFSRNAHAQVCAYEVREVLVFRSYHDFFVFHGALERESYQFNDRSSVGQTGTILPPLPRIPDVNSSDSAVQCCKELNLYMQHICALPENFLRARAIRGFLELRQGDKCQTTLVPHSRHSNTSTLDFDLASQLEDMNMRDSLGSGRPILSGSFTTKSVSEGPSLVDESIPTYRIKLMQRGKDPKMIAVSMPMKFSRQSLLVKVQEKLGHNVKAIETQEASGGPQISTDEDLQSWLLSCLRHGKKLLLFVDAEP